MYGLLGLAAIMGAAIWTMNLSEAYSALKELSNFGFMGKMVINDPTVQNKMLMHTLGAGALWIFGIGSVIYHFAPDAPESKSTVVSGVTEPAPAPVAPVVSETRPSDTRECPHCAEIIKAAAKLCRYCHSTVEPVSKTPVVQSPVEKSPEIPTLTVRAADKTPNPADFTWSLGGATVSKPINNPSSSRNSFRKF